MYFHFVTVYPFGLLRNPLQFPPTTFYLHFAKLTELPKAGAADLGREVESVRKLQKTRAGTDGHKFPMIPRCIHESDIDT